MRRRRRLPAQAVHAGADPPRRRAHRGRRAGCSGACAELEQAPAKASPRSTSRPSRRRCARCSERCARAAASDAPVLLRGESGTGKGVLARALHAQSARRARGRSSWSTARRSPRSCSRASSSATRAAPSPAPCATSRAASRRPRAARCSSTRSARSRRRCRPSCCASCRTRSSSASARRAPVAPTCASSPRPTATSRPTSRAGRFREDLYYRLERRRDPRAAAARAPRGHAPAGARFLAFFARAAGRRPASCRPRRRRRSLALRVAGQRARAAQRHRARAILWPARRPRAGGFPERMRGDGVTGAARGRRHARSTRSSASTSRASSRARRRSRRRRASSASTRRRCGASASATGSERRSTTAWNSRLGSRAASATRSELSQGRMGPRQREPEGRAPAHLAFDADLAAVGADDVARDREAEPGAAVPGRRAAARTSRRSPCPLLGGDAGALVGDLEAQRPSARRAARSRTCPPGGEWRMAFSSRLAKTSCTRSAIGLHGVAGGASVERERRGSALPPQAASCACASRSRRSGADGHARRARTLAALQAGQVEQLVDDRCRRSQSSRAAWSRSACLSVSGPATPSRQRWIAMRSEVSGVRNSCATVATRSFFSSSKRCRRVTSCSTIAAATTPPPSSYTGSPRGRKARSPSGPETAPPPRSRAAT